MSGRLTVLPWLVVLAACSASRSNSRPTIQLSGAVIRAQEDPLLGLSTYDAQTLFHLAGEAARTDNSERAERIYRKLIEEFPQDDLVAPARFNLARVVEDNKDFATAAGLYRVLYSDAALWRVDPRLTMDAGFRLAVCLVELAEHWEAVAVFDALLEVDLDDFDRLEAMLGRAIVIEKAGDIRGAELAYAHVLRFHREAQRRQRMHEHGMAAEAAFRMGMIALARFQAVELAFPVELLRQRLEEKCEQLLSAQSRFLRAIHLGDRYTVAQAGFRIGSMYAQLYDAIVALETPDELDEDQSEIYQEEVRKRVSVLLQKAIKIYEKSLMAGRPAPEASEWIARIERALEQLRELYLASSS